MEKPTFNENPENQDESKEIQDPKVYIKLNVEGLPFVSINGKQQDIKKIGPSSRSSIAGKNIYFTNGGMIDGRTLSIKAPEGTYFIGDIIPDDVRKYLSDKPKIGSLEDISKRETPEQKIQKAFLVLDRERSEIFETDENRKSFNDIYDNWDKVSNKQKNKFKSIMKIYIEMKDVMSGLGEIDVDDNFQVEKRNVNGNRTFVIPDKYSTYYGDLNVGNDPE